jgi:centrin-3
MTRTIPIASNLLNSTSLVSSHRPFIDNLVTEKILSRDPLEEVRKAFKLFDEDGTGRISLRNLRHIALELGENIDDDELRAMIDEFDLDGDGEINEQEFIAIMTEAGL